MSSKARKEKQEALKQLTCTFHVGDAVHFLFRCNKTQGLVPTKRDFSYYVGSVVKETQSEVVVGWTLFLKVDKDPEAMSLKKAYPPSRLLHCLTPGEKDPPGCICRKRVRALVSRRPKYRAYVRLFAPPRAKYEKEEGGGRKRKREEEEEEEEGEEEEGESEGERHGDGHVGEEREVEGVEEGGEEGEGEGEGEGDGEVEEEEGEQQEQDMEQRVEVGGHVAGVDVEGEDEERLDEEVLNRQLELEDYHSLWAWLQRQERNDMHHWLFRSRGQRTDTGPAIYAADTNTKHPWPASDPLIPGTQPCSYADEDLDSDEDFMDVKGDIPPEGGDMGWRETEGDDLRGLRREIRIMARSMMKKLSQEDRARLGDERSFVQLVGERVAQALVHVVEGAQYLKGRRWVKLCPNSYHIPGQRQTYVKRGDWEAILNSATALELPQQALERTESRLTEIYGPRKSTLVRR